MLLCRSIIFACALLLLPLSNNYSQVSLRQGETAAPTSKCQVVLDPPKGTQVYSSIWSPRSQQIVFTYTKDNKDQIGIINADGSNQRSLTSTLNLDRVRNPSWSPDGKQIAFVASHMDRVSAAVDYSKDLLYLINADGTKPYLLISVDKPEYSSNKPAYGELFYRWLSGGHAIAFFSPAFNQALIHTISTDENDAGNTPFSTGVSASYFVPSPTTNETALVDYGNGLHIIDSQNKLIDVAVGKPVGPGLSWSPDGQYLAITSKDGIYRIDARRCYELYGRKERKGASK